MIKLSAKELRVTTVEGEERKQIERNPIYIICDNILDTYNVGSIFRLADAVGAAKVYLCGVTETPPNTRIKKASINTTEWVEWEYFEKTEDAISDLRKKFPAIPSVIPGSEATPKSHAKRDTGQVDDARMGTRMTSGIQIVSVEQDSRSVSFNTADYQLPIAFMVHNETTGASKEILDLADMIVEIPMWGVNKSLNVMVSLGIVLFNMAAKKLK